MSKKNFYFEEWFNSRFLDKQIHNTHKHAMLDLLTNGVDVSCYYNSQNLVPKNLGFIHKDLNNKYFIDIQLPRSSDINTEFIAYPYYGSKNSISELTLSLIVNDKSFALHPNIKIVNVCSIFTELKIRLTFNSEPFAVRLKYLSYLLQASIRQDLIKQRFIQDGIMYSEGVAMPYNTFDIALPKT